MPYLGEELLQLGGPLAVPLVEGALALGLQAPEHLAAAAVEPEMVCC